MRKRQSERELMITNIQASVQGEVTQALSSPFNTTMTMYIKRQSFVTNLNILEKDVNRASANFGKFDETGVVSNLAEHRQL